MRAAKRARTSSKCSLRGVAEYRPRCGGPGARWGHPGTSRWSGVGCGGAWSWGWATRRRSNNRDDSVHAGWRGVTGVGWTAQSTGMGPGIEPLLQVALTRCASLTGFRDFCVDPSIRTGPWLERSDLVVGQGR